MTANYSRVVATVGLRRLTGHYSSLLFTPLLLVTCLALLAPWLLTQALAPLLLALLSLLLLAFKIWFRSTQVKLACGPEIRASDWSIPRCPRCRGAPWPRTMLTSAWPAACSPWARVWSHSGWTGGPHISASLTTSAWWRRSVGLKLVLHIIESFCFKTSSPPRQNQRLIQGFRCLCLYIDYDKIGLGLKILFPGIFVFLQACFWLRVVSVDDGMSDFEKIQL